MAINLSAIAHSNWLSTNGTCTASVTVPAGAKKLVIYGWSWFDGSPVETVAAPIWSGQAATQVAAPVVGNGYYSYIFEFNDPAPGTGNLTWNPSATAKTRSFSAYSVSSENILSVNYFANTGFNVTPAISIGSAANDFSVFGLMYRQVTTDNITEGAGQVVISENQTDFFAYRGISTKTATGVTNAASWTNAGTNNRWGALVANFRETVAAQTVPTITKPIVIGSAMAATTTGFTNVTGASAIGLTATGVTFNSGTGSVSAVFPPLAEGQIITVPLPTLNKPVLFTGPNGESATVNTDFDLPTSYSSQTTMDVITDDDKFATFYIPASDNDRIYYENVNGVVIGSNGSISYNNGLASFTFKAFLHKTPFTAPLVEYLITTPASVSDTTPNAFSFNAVTGAALNSVITSNSVPISGTDAPAPISIVGGEYRIGAGAWVTAPGTIAPGASVSVRLTSSALNSTAATATLTIGGVTAVFTVTTLAAAIDTTPNAGTFGAITNADINSQVELPQTVVIAGVTAGADVLVVPSNGSSYRVSTNGSTYGAWTSAQTFVRLGYSIQFRAQSSALPSTQVQPSLTIGGVVFSGSITTGLPAVVVPKNPKPYKGAGKMPNEQSLSFTSNTNTVLLNGDYTFTQITLKGRDTGVITARYRPVLENNSSGFVDDEFEIITGGAINLADNPRRRTFTIDNRRVSAVRFSDSGTGAVQVFIKQWGRATD